MEGSSACSPSISNVSINKTTVPLAEREGWGRVSYYF